MSDRRNRKVAALALFGCAMVLVGKPSYEAQAAEHTVQRAELREGADSTGELERIVTDNASTLGFGRLYPFSMQDGTGELYSFKTTAGKSYYQIKAFVTAGSFIHADIYDAAGSQIVAQTELKDAEYECFALEPSKTYYLKLSGDTNAAGEVIVSELADDYADTAEGAEKVAFGQEYSVTTECSGDVDYLAFTTGKKDVTYSFILDSTAGIACSYELQNEAGEKVAEGVTNPEKKLTKKLTLEQEKMYYLKITSEKAYARVLLTVKETVNQYKITYHLNGGKNHKSNPASYTAEQTVTLLEPTRENYIFEGWYTTSKYTEVVKGFEGAEKRNFNLYARWKSAKPGKATIRSLSSTGAGKAKLVFGAVTGSKGYQIRITRIVNGKKVVKYQFTNNTTRNYSGWKQGEKYYIAVRAYGIDSCRNKIYGAYSKTEKVTIQKKKVKAPKKKK